MKRKLKSLLALCCVVIMLATSLLSVLAVADMNTGVSQTPTAGLTEITFSDFGIDDGTYATNGDAGTYLGASTLIGTVFSGKVKFDTSSKDGLLYIGGKNDTDSFLIRVGKSSIRIYTEGLMTRYGITDLGKEDYKFFCSDYNFGFNTFVNQEFELKLTFECANQDGDTTANDLKLGMWVNGTLCNNNSYIYMEDYLEKDIMGTNLHVCGGNEGFGGIPTVTSIIKEAAPTELKELTFKDFGIDNGTYETNGVVGTYADTTNLINTVFSGYVSFDTAGKNASGQDRDALVYIGGNNDTTSLLLRVGRKSIRLMCEAKNSAGVEYISKANAYQFWNTEFDIETFVNYQFELKLSFECVNRDNDTTANDLKLGMWIDGTLCSGDYIYVEDYVDDMGTNLHILGGAEGYKAIPTVTSIVKETESTEIKELTFKDFGIDNGTYETNGVVGTYADATNLMNTVFSGYVSFDTAGKNASGQDRDALVYIGGNNDTTSLLLRVGRKSIRLMCEAKNSAGVEYISKANAYQFWNTDFDIETFVNYEFELKLSFECVNRDNDTTANDLKLGMWIDGTLCGGDYIYVEDYVDVMGTNLHILGGAEGYKAIPTVKSIGIEPPVVLEKLPEGLKKITFTDFDGVKEGTYTKNQSTNGQYNGDSLNGTVLEGKITFKRVSGGDPVLIIGGKKNKGHGLVLRTMKNASGEVGLRLYSDPSPANAITTRYFYSDVAGTTLVGKELDLKISFEFVNNDNGTTQNDLKLGMWFADKLYNNQYIYLNNYVDTEYALGTLFYACGIEGGSVTLGKAPDEEIPARLQEITFQDFEGFKDGAYTNNETSYGTYAGNSLSGKVLAGTVTFNPVDNANPMLVVGGKDEMQHGLVLQTAINADSGEHYLSLHTAPEEQGSTRYSFYSEKAGVPLVGEALNLRLSFQFVNNDGGSTDNDLKLGVWFDGKLYENEYIYLNNYVDTAYALGNYLYVCGTDESTITLESVKQETMPEGLTELSFWDFGINDGIYQNTKSATNPYYGDTLDKTVLKGKVTFSVPGKDGSALLAIGSKSKQWYGLTLKSYENPTTGETFLRLYDAQKRAGYSKEYYFYPEVAGMELVESEVDLQMSFEFVDQDGDNRQNDLKLGVWFGDKLYNNKYIYFHDYVDTNTTMGTYLSVYAPKGSSIILKSVETYDGEISYTTFGLTKDWQAQLLSKQVKLDVPVGGSHTSNTVPNTGDSSVGWLWGILSLGCFITITLIRKRERLH